VLGIDPGTGQWLHTVDESNAGNSRCIPLQMDRWEVHSFATTLSTSGTAKFTIAAFRYFNDTVPDAGGNGATCAWPDTTASGPPTAASTRSPNSVVPLRE
jgi:hypothetical protein